MKHIKFLQVFTALLLTAALLIAAPAAQVAAESTGPNNVGTGANIDRAGGPDWLNPGNITTAGSPYASVTVSVSNVPSDYLRASNFGFAIPADATISGVTVSVNRRITTGTASISDSIAQLVNDSGALFGNSLPNGNNWTTTFAPTTYGGAANMWGLTTTTLTPAVVNNANFGFELSVRKNGTGSRIAEVDYIQITVNYKRGDTTAVNCGGGIPTVAFGGTISCTATVTRSFGTNTPTGTVSWTSSGTGTITTSPCNLATTVDGSAACSITYKPTVFGTGSHLITATYSGDTNFVTGSGNQAVTVTDQAPVITSDGGGATASVTVPQGATQVTTVTATDADPGATLAFSITGGADAALFAINASSGQLAFLSPHTVAAPADANLDNIYEVIVQVSDGYLTDSQAISAQVSSASLPPTITSNGGGDTAAINIPENSTAVTTVTATDPQLLPIIYSIIGGADSTLFTINSLTGELTLISPLNFEVRTDAGLNGVYDVIVQASNGTLTDTQAIAVTITDVNEAPSITDTKPQSVTMLEDDPASFVLTLHATDPDAGATLTWSIPSGGQALHGTATASGTGTSKAIGYTPAANYNGTDTFIVQVSDGALTDTIIVNVTITPVGDDYYVNNTGTPVCDNYANDGRSLDKPFCDITRGATVSRAGDTVHVVAGTYLETVWLLSYNGTAGYPITFTADPSVVVKGNGSATSGAAFYLNGRSYIVINGFHVTQTAFKGIYVIGSDHITLSNNHISLAGNYAFGEHQQGIHVQATVNSLITGNITETNSCIGIRLSHSSNNNVISNNTSFNNYSYTGSPLDQTDAAGIELDDSDNNLLIHNITYGNEDSGINLYVSTGDGSQNNQVIGNLSYGNGDHGIDNNTSSGSILIGNTVHGNYTSGINLELNSGGATLANNILMDNGLNPGSGRKPGNVYVDDTSYVGTTMDYNLYYRNGGQYQIRWNATSYATLALFQAGVPGQEVHGLEGNPLFVAPAPVVTVDSAHNSTSGDYHLQAGSPAIDSANSAAPGEPLTDIEGNPRADDPLVANTGAGTRTYDDRGVFEYQPPIPLLPTSLVTQPVTENYGNTAVLTATISPVLEGKIISFALNGVSACSVPTNASGVATCTVPLTVNIGTYDTGVLAVFGGDTTYAPSSNTAQLVVNPRPVTGAFTADNKVYDGNTTAAVLTRSLVGVYDADDVSLTGGTAAFDDKNIGDGKTVTLTGATLTGTASGNYTLTSVATTTANITALHVTGAFTADNKVYDGTTTATVLTRSLIGAVGTDTVSLDGGTATFADKVIGNGKVVTLVGAVLGGADAGNYVLDSVATTTANITPLHVTGAFTADNKVYDSTTAAVVLTRSLVGAVVTDDVSLTGGTATFADKLIGDGKTVTLAGAALTGVDAGNYVLDSVATATANITALHITGSFTADNKVYDGNNSATVLTRVLNGAVTTDTVSLDGGTATFADKNIGDGKVVTLTGAALSGADAGNYVLDSVATTLANITPLHITGAFTADNKIYDGNNTAAVLTRSLVGAISGDDVSLNGGTATFADKNVEDGKVVTLSGATLIGTDSGNYVLDTVATTTADITPLHITGSFTAADKVFDGTTTAVVLTRSLNGVLAGDVAELTGGTAEFDTPDIGNNKTVTLTGATLTGADSGNYALDSVATTTASIIGGFALTDLDLLQSVDQATWTNVPGSFAGGFTMALDPAVPYYYLDAANLVSTRPLADGMYPFFMSSHPTTGFFEYWAGRGVDGTGTERWQMVLWDIIHGVQPIFYLQVSNSGTDFMLVDGFQYIMSIETVINPLRVDGTYLLGAYTFGGTVYDTLGYSDNVSVSIEFVAPLALTDLDLLKSPDKVTWKNVPGSLAGGFTMILNPAVPDTYYYLDAANLVSNRTIADGYYPFSVNTYPAGFFEYWAGRGVVSGATGWQGIMWEIINGNQPIFYLKVSGPDVMLVDGLTKLAGGGDTPLRIEGSYLLGSYSFTGSVADTLGYTDEVSVGIAFVPPVELTVSGITANNKTYDGTPAATLDLTAATLVGVVSPDDVTLVTSAVSGVFSDKNAAPGKTVTISGLALGGADMLDYVLTQPTATADITPLSITGSFTTENKVYNGNSDAAVLTRTLNGVLGTDVVNLTGGTAAFDNKNVGTGKTVTLSGATLAGADSGNYELGSVTTTTADITPLHLTASFTAGNKIYNGTKTAAVLSFDAVGVISGDNIEFALLAEFSDKNVGTGKTVSLTSASILGLDAGNYVLDPVASTTADITPLSISGEFTAQNKIYDGNNSANVLTRSLVGAISGDVVSLTGGTATFADKNVADGKTVTLIGATLDGTDSGNYTLDSVATATANITPLHISGEFTADNKVYDGNNTATVLTRSLVGAISGDVVSLSGGTATFADKNVANGKDVTLTGATLSGVDSGNYVLTSVATAKADITPLSITGSFTAQNKVYDGTADAVVLSRALDGVLSGDVVSLSGGTATFENKNAANNKTVTLTGAVLAGADSGNYTLASVDTTTANITPKGLTVTGITAADKVYNGTTAAALNTTAAALEGVLSPDAVTLDVTAAVGTFADKNVGPAKQVTVSGLTLAGTDATNYSLTQPTTSAAITPRDLTVTAAGVDKVYDGTTDATVNLSTDKVSGDALTASYTGATFADKNAAPGIVVSVVGISISGADAGNYNLLNNTASTAAAITPRPITVTADAKTKGYGSVDPALTWQITSGTLVAGDGFTGGLIREAGEGIGSYAILVNDLSYGSNYAMSYIGANLTITGFRVWLPITIR